MTDETLGTLFRAFAHFYWSVPVKYVVDKLSEWHPEVTASQIETVLNRCNDDLFWQHCCVETEGLEEPELVTEHLIIFGRDDLEQFVAARSAGPYCDCEEEALLRSKENRLCFPEAKAIIDFGKTELGLDREWSEQLVLDCCMCQSIALQNGESWVKEVLLQEQFGKIRFQTIEQVKRFRALGNQLYQVLPNPIFKGWKPSEIEHPPLLPDDIPEKEEDIPDGRHLLNHMNDLFANLDGGEHTIHSPTQPSRKRKIGRNEPCPCGSGKKYKKCCGR